MQRIDAPSVEAHDRRAVDTIAERLAVASRNLDLIADRDILQETKMRIAVRGIDRSWRQS